MRTLAVALVQFVETLLKTFVDRTRKDRHTFAHASDFRFEEQIVSVNKFNLMMCGGKRFFDGIKNCRPISNTEIFFSHFSLAMHRILRTRSKISIISIRYKIIPFPQCIREK